MWESVWESDEMMTMDERLTACFKLRRHYTPYTKIAGGLEVISLMIWAASR